MRRREFVGLVGGAAAWPLAARAQQPPVTVIGYLVTFPRNDVDLTLAAFRKGLSEAGFVEDRNVAIEYRFAENNFDRLPELAADLVRRRVAVIVTPSAGTAPALAAKAATTTIPIVFGTGGDPIQMGLVASLNRPGGNVTGVAVMNVEIVPKRLGILRELLPKAARIGVLVNPNNPNTEPIVKGAQAAAPALGQEIEVVTAGNAREIDAAFASLAQKRIDALLINPDPLYVDRRAQIVTLATRLAMPAIFGERDSVAAGGLMSYGASQTDLARQVGLYVGRILKGEKPAELPVMQAVKFEFIINLRTAKALGLTIPSGVLSIVDEVIE
jgi:putative tryptophan/tyrosine transport system substrate-binding protein